MDWTRSDVVSALALLMSLGSLTVVWRGYRRNVRAERPIFWAQDHGIVEGGSWHYVKIRVRNRAPYAIRCEQIEIMRPHRAVIVRWEDAMQRKDAGTPEVRPMASTAPPDRHQHPCERPLSGLDMRGLRIARLFAWLVLFVIVFMTVGPREFRPYTGVEHHLEHFLAFVLLGLVFGVGYFAHRFVVALIGVVLAALLEIVQLWVPGRHARLNDFLVDAVGVCVGLASVAFLDRLKRQRTG